MSANGSTTRQRWTIFLVLALMYILVYFYRVSLAVVAGDISRELRLTPEQLGSLAGVLFYVYAVVQIPLGPMIDRFGSRLVISGCGVLTTAGGILFSRADSLGDAMTARILIGVGTASVLMATFTLFGHWYSRQEFGRVSGLMVAVGNVGNLIGTAPLAASVGLFGWRPSFLAIGIIQALVTVLVFCKVQDRPSASIQAAAPPDPSGAPAAGMLAAWREIFTSRDFWLLGMIAFFWYGNYLALQGLWGGPYLMDVLHLSRSAAGNMLMCTSIGFIAGSLVTDTIARRIFRSYKKTLLVGQVLLALLMTAFLGWAEMLSPPFLAVLFLVIGLVVSSGVMIYPIIRSMFPLNIVGTALTSLNFFVLMGAAATQQIMGLIIGSQVGLRGAAAPAAAFHSAFIFPLAGLLLSIVLFSQARDYHEQD
ncbi:MAG TPA: MFS transporter [Desulfuromonadales bacterium]|nr:MFS transporter [Desulfuromonadales bacterium]